MCGIAGFLGRFEPELLGRMGAMIAHRGPDDQGIFHHAESGVGLAHRRLSIIDLSTAGRQPMWDSTGTVVVCFNGEIYNFPELRAELAAQGVVFNSHCDTEILPNLYLREGPEFLRRLNGIFAFALWDTRQQIMLVARDGCGVKPLYYAQTAPGFLFASELKALLQSDAVDRTIEPTAIAHHLSYLYCPAPRTMLRGVSKLEPGHAMIVDRTGVRRKWQFYELPYDQPIAKMSESEAAEGVRHYLKQAVRRQMLADVPVGSFLSGGLDSSSVVAFAREHARNGSIDCFTIGFNDPRFVDGGEDLPHARRVAEHLKVPLHTVWVGPEIAGELERMVYQLDEPLPDPAALNVFFISRLAREHGMKVLLSGAGGDDLFTGYRRHRALDLERWWSWLPATARRALKRSADLFRKDHAIGRRLSKAFAYADQPADRRLVGYFLWSQPSLVTSLLSRDTLAGLGTFDPMAPMLAALGGLPPGVPPLNRMLFLDGKYFLTDHNLNYTDKMSMAAGVEVRVPYLDPDLMAFAARLPLGLKQRGNVGKWIFKRAMEPLLPRESIYRSKVGFGVPLEGWLKHELREMVDDTLSADSLRRRGLFDPAAVARLLAQERAGQLYAAYPILGLMCVELWCRAFIDRRPVPPFQPAAPRA